MTDNTEALPPLPEKRWAGFCSKCHSTTQFQKRPNTKAAPCGRCGYATFCEELDYSDDEMRTYARAALAQRQQVPDVRLEDDDALRYVQRVLESDATQEDRNQARNEIVKIRTRVREYALTAAPSAQAETVRRLHSFSSIDCEALIAACVPGGSVCDPQHVADSIRRYLNAWPAAQAEQEPARGSLEELRDMLRAEVDRLLASPQRAVEPLTDEQIDKMPFPLHEPDQGGVTVTEALRLFARAIERAHGIGKQEGK